MAVFLPLSTDPMAPISNAKLPQGPEWIYQLKWDGVRILAMVGQDSTVKLFSRKMLLKNAIYPEIEKVLADNTPQLGPCVLDGEIIYWDGIKPNFQKVLQRERSKQPNACKNNERLIYVVFDILQDGDQDLRELPFGERNRLLQEKLRAIPQNDLIATELYTDGEALWEWVQEHQWEGIVSKRITSPYREGKKHQDWLKKKTALVLDITIVGVKRREGRAASLVMSDQGNFIGSVSLGLNEAMRETLENALQLRSSSPPSWPMPFPNLPSELKREDIVWLPSPLPCQVTGLELTSAGLLRHPKLVAFGRAKSQEEDGAHDTD